MAPASLTTVRPDETVASLIRSMGEAFARRLNDPHTCFIDWCVGALFVGVFVAALAGVGVTLAYLIDHGALWSLVALVLVTRSNSAIVRSVAEWVRGKYGGAHGGAKV